LISKRARYLCWALRPRNIAAFAVDRPAPRELLIDPALLDREYFQCRPDVTDLEQLVRFGASGDFRRRAAHPLEVLAANQIETIIQRDSGVTQPPSSPAPSWFTIAAAESTSPTAFSSFLLTIPRKTVASSTTRRHRPLWPNGASVGKTVVGSAMIDSVVRKLGRSRSEVPVSFKWFVPGLEALGSLPLIAEDLGVITPDVVQLPDSQNLPGMRVLQLAFDGNPPNPHLPQDYAHNTVIYTGTHDNNTTRGWFDSLPEPQRQTLWAYLRRAPGESGEVAPELMRVAWSSPAAAPPAFKVRGVTQ